MDYLLLAASAGAAQGVDLTGVAALIAAMAGVVSAFGGLWVGLKTQKSKRDDVRADVLMEMLLKALDEPDDDPPKAAS